MPTTSSAEGNCFPYYEGSETLDSAPAFADPAMGQLTGLPTWSGRGGPGAVGGLRLPVTLLVAGCDTVRYLDLGITPAPAPAGFWAILFESLLV